MGFREKWGRFRHTARRHGLRGALLFLVRRICFCSPGGAACRLFLYALTDPRPSPRAREASRGHTFRFATADEVEALCRDPEADVESRDVEAFRSGCRCLLQLDGDRWVGYSWVSGSQLVELMWGLHYNMPEDTVYNYKGFTHPEYRGQGFQPVRHLKILEHVRERGGRRLFAYIDHLNFDSMRGASKSGYRRVGTLRITKHQDRVRVKLRVTRDFWSDERRAA